MTWRLCVSCVLGVAALTAQRVQEAAEPNQTVATATPLALGREAFGTLATTGDSDWYRITLTASSDLRIETAPGYGAELGDTFVSLLDGNGFAFRSNDDGVGCARYSRLYVNGLAAGTYYIAVDAGAFAVANGTYALDVRAAAPGSAAVPPIAAEGAENNDPRTGGVATAIALPARCNGQIPVTGPNGDWDFYRFTLATESFVQVRVDATPTHPAPPVMDDPILYLFDGATPPNLLAGPFYASSFAVWDTAIDVPLVPGTYQVAIRGWVGSIAGRYYLDIRNSDAARVTVAAGGCGGRTLDVARTTLGPGAPLRLERPEIGSTWCLRGSNLGAGGFAFHVVGFAATFVDLTAFGAPGCVLEVDYVDTPLQLADGAGNTVFAVAIPEAPALQGIALVSQIAVFDLSNALGVTFSNRVSGILGP